MAQRRNNAQVANDLRARRRRQRQRRAARRRSAMAVQDTHVNSVHRRGIAHENQVLQGIEHKEEEAALNEVIALQDVFSDNLIRFCEAVVHPFGNEAIGALLPDRYQELVIPVTDRLELDITPGLFNYAGDWTSVTGLQLTGAFFWFQPRCLSSGQITMFDSEERVSEPGPYPRAPYIGVDDTLSQLDQSVILNQYNLCFTGVWQNGTSNPPAQNNAPVTYGLYNSGEFDTNPIAPFYYAIQYSRFDSILNNCDKMRILGAGLKVWSEEAPINTGGFSVGGWITLEDVMEALEIGDRSPFNSPGPLQPGALKSIQPKIKFACRSPGVKGSTVRYSSLQSAEQVESEYPKIPERMYEIVFDAQSKLALTAYVDETTNTDLSMHDVITPGSFVPCIYWQFNINTTTNMSEVYTLKVMSMVHSEGTPTGESPFMSNKSSVDPGTQHAKQMMENLEAFPAATKGHSFKSFMKKTRHVIAKIKKGAGVFTKLIGLADKAAALL